MQETVRGRRMQKSLTAKGAKEFAKGAKAQTPAAAASAGLGWSRISRTLRARVFKEKGFCRKRVVTSIAPWCWKVVSA